MKFKEWLLDWKNGEWVNAFDINRCAALREWLTIREKEKSVKLEEVVSSNISHVGYDAESSTLTVQFKAGGTYEYEAVPHMVYLDLLNAQSVGAFFAKNIRNKYATRKVVSPSQSSS